MRIISTFMLLLTSSGAHPAEKSLEETVAGFSRYALNLGKLAHPAEKSLEETVAGFSRYALNLGKLARANASLGDLRGAKKISFVHDKKTRTARLYVPHANAPPNQGWPLVVDFHAWGSDSLGESFLTDFSSEAETEGFLVVYPEGYGQANAGVVPLPIDPGIGFTFNAGGCCPAACALDKVDDVGFAVALVDYIASTEFTGVDVDRNRVYATGMSNGGFMSHRIGCEASEVFAAIAPVSGLLMNDTSYAGVAWSAQKYSCAPKRAVPVLHFHGSADPLVPIAGNSLLGFKTVKDTIDAWRVINGAEGDGEVTYRRGYVSCESWGTDQNNVTYCLAQGAGHSWPGSHKGCLPRLTPAVGCTHDIDATKEIWQFFKRHTL